MIPPVASEILAVEPLIEGLFRNTDCSADTYSTEVPFLDQSIGFGFSDVQHNGNFLDGVCPFGWDKCGGGGG
jgi:hypothetical protein